MAPYREGARAIAMVLASELGKVIEEIGLEIKASKGEAAVALRAVCEKVRVRQKRARDLAKVR